MYHTWGRCVLDAWRQACLGDTHPTGQLILEAPMGGVACLVFAIKIRGNGSDVNHWCIAEFSSRLLAWAAR